MSTMMEQEVRVGAMIRTMSGEVRDAMKSQIYELYDAKEEAEENEYCYKESCARWHWLILVYTDNINDTQELLDFIQVAYDNKINLDEDEDWKKMMRVVLPVEFKKSIKYGFTQVPRLAVLNQTPLRKDSRKPKRKAVFNDLFWG